MVDLKHKLRAHGFKGEIDTTVASKDFYSHDASMFELVPQAITFPKDSQDVCTLVRFVRDTKKNC